jgi:hypothetical protein
MDDKEKQVTICAKCGNPTTEVFEVLNLPLCRLCASWFGYSMIRLRATLSNGTSAS